MVGGKKAEIVAVSPAIVLCVSLAGWRNGKARKVGDRYGFLRYPAADGYGGLTAVWLG